MKIEDNISYNLGKHYYEHNVFNKLDTTINFYNSLSFSVLNWTSSGTKAIINIDTYSFSSIRETLKSIKEVIHNGRINDSYALLRKYYDSTMINIYANLYLNDHFSIDNFIVSQIDNWVKGKEKLPEYRIIHKYIIDSPKLKPISTLLRNTNAYKQIRQRCNDHTHYNFFHFNILNDPEVFHQDRLKYLTMFANDLDSLFIQHFSYLFFLQEHYMSSSDYLDSLEVDLEPEEGSQYWVASFVQEAFDNIIKSKRPDIAKCILEHTSMQLD